MVRCRWRGFFRTLLLIGSGLLLTSLSIAPLVAGTSLKLTWDPNTEPDLARYTVYYTAPGVPTKQVTVPASSGATYTFQDLLLAGTTYSFVVTASDEAGNESLRSNQVSAQPTVTIGPSPTVASASELSSSSIYILQ